MKTIIQADELPQDVAGAEELLARHSEHKMELDARKHIFQSFQNKGKKLIAASHYARLEVTSFCKLTTMVSSHIHCMTLTIIFQIQEKMIYLDKGHRALLELWEARNIEYDHHLDFLKFQHEAEQAEGWIALREAFLQNEDYGVKYASLDSIK